MQLGVPVSVYPVWYATNRKISNSGSPDYFSSDRSAPNKVEYGKLFVEITDDYLKELGRQGFWKYVLSQAPEAKLKVREPIQMTSSEFGADVRDELKALSPDERIALVYIHGFQTTFVEAAQRAAGIGYQLKIPMTAFYSWPSKGRVADYVADYNAALDASDDLARFLIKFSRDSKASRIHIIAHSMGNFALLQAMYRPVMQDAKKKGLKFGQIILAAADVDAGVFMKDAHVYTEMAERVTLYASSSDLALKASIELSKFPRAGFLPPVTVHKSIDAIDVSDVNLTLLGHAYLSGEIAVLEDMSKLIRFNQSPGARTRIWRASGNGQYWVMK
jgi:esterase/lipase superfamily enzyme